MQSHLQALIGYFSAHAALALALVFAGAMLEALAVVGSIIPGSTAVFIGGTLIGLGVLNPWWTAAAAIIGAILGDGLSFWLGQHYGERIRSAWPMRKHPQLFERGRAYFEKRGASSIFIGRFLGPLRAIVPLVAGMSHMPSVKFYGVNILSAFAWAAAHLLPGLAFGASLQLAGAVSSRLVVMLIVVVVTLGLLLKVWVVAKRYSSPVLGELRDKAVAAARRRPGPVSSITLSLLDPTRPESGALLAATVLLAGSAWLFGAVLEDIFSRDPLVVFDQSVFVAFQALRTGWADNIMLTITEAGGPVGTIALVVVISALLAALRYWRTLGYWLATTGVAELLVWVLKPSIARQRPHNFYAGLEQYSLPSGHTTLSVVVYGFMAFLLARGRPAWQRTVIAASAGIVILAVSGSRIYLGVHWFSDVVASLSLGLAWLAVVSIAYLNHVSGERLRPLPVALLMAGTVVLVGGTFAAVHHDADVSRYAYTAPVKTTTLAAWKAGGWRDQPAARSEVGGDTEEPFSVQWVGTRAKVADVLTAQGWKADAGLGPASILRSLLPSAPIDQLPVFPRFDHGRIQAMTFVKQLNAKERVVLRLWGAHMNVVMAQGPAVPLWFGTATVETAEHAAHIGSLPRTRENFAQPVQLLSQDVRKANVFVTDEKRNGPVVLLW
jgi:membrane protein DedA with SNARE-associated domain/membrane-associated phospholipid phosphatase